MLQKIRKLAPCFLKSSISFVNLLVTRRKQHNWFQNKITFVSTSDHQTTWQQNCYGSQYGFLFRRSEVFTDSWEQWKAKMEKTVFSEVSAKPLWSIAGICTENPLHLHHYFLCLQGTQLLYFHVSFPQLNLGKGTRKNLIAKYIDVWGGKNELGF